MSYIVSTLQYNSDGIGPMVSPVLANRGGHIILRLTAHCVAEASSQVSKLAEKAEAVVVKLLDERTSLKAETEVGQCSSGAILVVQPELFLCFCVGRGCKESCRK